MKFVCLGRIAGEPENLKREYKYAEQWGEVRLSEEHFFYRYFIKIRYVSYAEIQKVYLREESGESGEFLLKEFYLMVETADGVLHKLRMEREEKARSVLQIFSKEHPAVQVGFNRLSQSKV